MAAVTSERPAEGVALITLNRPDALNAFDGAMRADLIDALAEASNDSALRAIVLTGAGRGFSAGADVKDISGGRNVEDVLNTEYGAFLNIVRTCEKPVIAAINGPAAGIGMTLALTCDLKVMDPGAFLMSAFANIGLVPDGGLSWLLTQQIGYARAYQLAIEAERIDAARALEFGLVNRVSAPGAAVGEAIAWAQTLTRRAPIALALTKRAFRAAAEEGAVRAMMTEAMFQRTAIMTEDCREGVTALLEKRPANFKGR